MPNQEDVGLLRKYITDKMNLMLNDSSYEIFDSSSFVQLRNLIVTRLTMFNARRSGEPVRLTLTEWEDACCDAWLDPRFVDQIDNPQEKELLPLRVVLTLGEPPKRIHGNTWNFVPIDLRFVMPNIKTRLSKKA